MEAAGCPWCQTMAWSRRRAQTIYSALALCTVVLCSLVLAGCQSGRLPRIDPSGERLFVAAPEGFEPEPGVPGLFDTLGVSLTPSKVIAPVGSEVVLLAGVCGPEGFMLANERVEWMIAPHGEGQFVALGRKAAIDWLVGFRTWPRKVTNTYAIGTTSSRYVVLTRGTPSPADDVNVLRGQAWVTVMSPVEGTSFITVLAPSTFGWDRRQRTATIHWIDAQWVLPPPAINPAGSRQILTTTVTTHTNQAPLRDWLVHYEIVGGPPAGFAPNGDQVLEVPSDELGQASVEIFQQTAEPGTNQIAVEIIRPAGPLGSERLVVGSGTTQRTWTAPDIAVDERGPAPDIAVDETGTAQGTRQEPTADAIGVTVSGPREATVGQDVTFQIRVTNRGPSSATGLVVVDRYDVGLEHATLRNPIERDLDDLAPGQSREVAVTLRVAKAGRLCHTVEVHSGKEVRASANACLQASQAAGTNSEAEVPAEDATPKLTVTKTGPTLRQVGQRADFVIEIKNTGTAAATHLRIADSYDSTLNPVFATDGHSFAGDEMIWQLDQLPPGKTVRFQVQCDCLEVAARACNRVVVTCDEQITERSEACLKIRAAAKELAVTITRQGGPVKVGGEAIYEVQVTNNATESDRQVAVQVTVDEETTPQRVGSSGPAKYTISGRRVRFEPVDEIRPAETLTYRIRVSADRAGQARCRVRVISERVKEALTATETTTIGEIHRTGASTHRRPTASSARSRAALRR